MSKAAEELDRKIFAYDQAHAIAKKAEKQLKALKAWFKAQAGDEDMDFVSSDGKVTIRVFEEDRSALDHEKVEAKLGDEMAKCYTTSPVVKVTISRAKKTKKAKRAKAKVTKKAKAKKAA